MQAIRAAEYGGPEVMRLEALTLPGPAADEVRVRVAFAGVSFRDTLLRAGPPRACSPAALGVEGAGEVEAVGRAVRDLRVGQRVAWADVPGSYATHVNAKPSSLVPIPDPLTSEAAAAALVHGLLCELALEACGPWRAGALCAVHGAAGGLGLWLTQGARARGARVVALVSTDAKAALALAAGAEHAVLTKERDFGLAVLEYSRGAGAQVVLDSVGADTWERSLHCLAPGGTLALLGETSGAVTGRDPTLERRRGLRVVTPRLSAALASPGWLQSAGARLFGKLLAGEVDLRVDRVLPLSAAAEAHRLLAARETTGKLLLKTGPT